MDALLRVRDGFLSCEAQLDGVHKSLSKPYLTSAPRWQIIVDDRVNEKQQHSEAGALIMIT